MQTIGSTPANQDQENIIEKIVTINRVTKVTKGGKKMSFTALVVMGDGNGRVGMSLGKANEVSDAIRKGLNQCRKAMFKIKLKGTTIPHDIVGEFGAAKVMLKPAFEGTGIIAAGSVRAVCEAAGIKDILTKCVKSNNPVNVIKATLLALSKLMDEEEVARLRVQVDSENVE